MNNHFTFALICNNWHSSIAHVRKFILDFPKSTIIIYNKTSKVIPEFSAQKNNNITSINPLKKASYADAYNDIMQEAKSQGVEEVIIIHDDDLIRLYKLPVPDTAFAFVKLFFNGLFLIPFIALWIKCDSWNIIKNMDGRFTKPFYIKMDYLYRLKLLKNNVIGYSFFKAVGYKPDFKKDGIIEDHQYYIEKWGGCPGEEKFKNPFNKE